MTDLTGVELARETARVMGKRVSILSCGEDTCLIAVDGRGPVVEFRPDLGGAAAWEVLEWVRRRYEVIFADQDDDPRLVWCDISTDPHNRICHVVGAYGPTDAIALCSAVVALGDAG